MNRPVSAASNTGYSSSPTFPTNPAYFRLSLFVSGDAGAINDSQSLA